MQPDDPTPYVLSDRAIKIGWLPPKGISALPGFIRKKVPKEFQYWKMGRKEALEARKRLAAMLEAGELVVPELKKPKEPKKPAKKEAIVLSCERI